MSWLPRSPGQYTYRSTIGEIEIPGGDPVPPGAEIILLLAAANRDPAVFDEPHLMDVTRPNARGHPAFASGPHHCVSAELWRMEADATWRVLTGRRPDVGAWELAGEPTPTETGRLVRAGGHLTVHPGRNARAR